MLRASKSHHGFFKHVKSNIGGLFPTNSAKNKKYDGDESKMRSFDFSEIQSAIKNRSIQQLIQHESGIAVLICAICIFIVILYVIIAVFSSSLVINYNESTITSQYDNELIIEIEEVLSKLIKLRQNGNMKDYETFLQPTMQKYCLNHLGKKYMNIKALESFHMNIAETISFISAGNTFIEHKALVVTDLGAIIDPSSSKGSDAKTCPLLTALYELGAEKQVHDNKTTKNDKETKDKKDSGEKFDQQYSWQNMQEFMELMFTSITKSGECLRIAKELKKENIKLFILNFYEMADIIGTQTAKEEKEGATDLGLYHADPNSAEYRKYVIGRDGGVYETDKELDNSDEYLHCTGVEEILNDKFVLDDNLSYTNVKIAIDETFDEWYNILLKKIK